jgi:hypothetical protein
MSYLPERLRAAYDWTSAAGELEELRAMHPEDLDGYAHESAANARTHGVSDVSVCDVIELSLWLNGVVGGGDDA